MAIVLQIEGDNTVYTHTSRPMDVTKTHKGMKDLVIQRLSRSQTLSLEVFHDVIRDMPH